MNLLKSLATVSLITVFSRIFGFIRDLAIASTFGASIETDAFFIAFKLPNFLRRLFAEGAFIQSIIPILTEYKNKQEAKDVRVFISYISGLLILVLIIVSVIGMISSPWIVIVTAPGFVDATDKFILTSCLLRYMFPYIIFISLSSFIGAILNTWNYFYIPAFSPIFLNITMICFILFVTPYFKVSVLTLAWSVIIGGILQLIYQLPFLKKIGMLVLPRINFSYIDTICVFKKIIPSMIGVSIHHISLVINTIFTSFLISGSVSWIYYADRLIEFPSGVLGVTLSTILLPSLSKCVIYNNYDEYSNLIDWGLRLCFLLALPSATALGILSKPLLITLFQYGKFTATDVMMTRKILIVYSIGLVGFIIVKVLASSFYSRNDTKIPVKIGVITLIITQIMNLLLIGPLKQIGLSLSIDCASYLNAILLYYRLRKQNIFIPQPGWMRFMLCLIVALTVMSITLISVLHFMPDWTLGNMMYRLFRLLAVIIIGAIAYFVTLIILGFRIKEFIRHISI